MHILYHWWNKVLRGQPDCNSQSPPPTTSQKGDQHRSGEPRDALAPHQLQPHAHTRSRSRADYFSPLDVGPAGPAPPAFPPSSWAAGVLASPKFGRAVLAELDVFPGAGDEKSETRHSRTSRRTGEGPKCYCYVWAVQPAKPAADSSQELARRKAALCGLPSLHTT